MRELHMEKFEYAELKQKLEHANWYYFLNDERLGDQYSYVSLIEALNIIGQNGWQLVTMVDTDHYLVMREIGV